MNFRKIQVATNRGKFSIRSKTQTFTDIFSNIFSRIYEISPCKNYEKIISAILMLNSRATAATRQLHNKLKKALRLLFDSLVRLSSFRSSFKTEFLCSSFKQFDDRGSTTVIVTPEMDKFGERISRNARESRFREIRY